MKASGRIGGIHPEKQLVKKKKQPLRYKNLEETAQAHYVHGVATKRFKGAINSSSAMQRAGESKWSDWWMPSREAA